MILNLLLSLNEFNFFDKTHFKNSLPLVPPQPLNFICPAYHRRDPYILESTVSKEYKEIL
jgi:hypothetical protein